MSEFRLIKVGFVFEVCSVPNAVSVESSREDLIFLIRTTDQTRLFSLNLENSTREVSSVSWSLFIRFTSCSTRSTLSHRQMKPPNPVCGLPLSVIAGEFRHQEETRHLRNFDTFHSYPGVKSSKSSDTGFIQRSGPLFRPVSPFTLLT